MNPGAASERFPWLAVQPFRSLSACLFAVFGLLLVASPAAHAATAEGAVIFNGTVTLGVKAEGHLNYDCTADPSGCPPASGTSVGATVGLRFAPSNLEAIATGCLCEGWGLADAASGLTGFANEDTGISPNITVDSFTAPSADRAISVVSISDPSLPGYSMRVVHDYRPSPLTPNLFLDRVTVTNTGSQPLGDLRYRRVMDWDVEPTNTNEWVTIQGAAPELLFSSDDGFADSDPLSGPSYVEAEAVCGDDYTGPCLFTDLGEGGTYPTATGPADNGALFDFGIGALAAGQSKSFDTYYGAADSESAAVGALSTVGADVYSLGEPSCTGGTIPTCSDVNGQNAGVEQGMPATFMFGFVNSGGAASGTGQTGPVVAQAPPPVIFDSANAALVSGTVLIKQPDGTFKPLIGEEQIPLGSIVDTTNGVVAITSAKNKSGEVQTADFYGGLFRLVQVKGPGGVVLTQLVLLNDPSSRGLARKGPRKLWGNGKGNFKTKGGYGSATVRGTKWLTKDTDAGTLIKVVKGIVSVRDYARKKTTKVGAGKKLLVTPPGRPPGKVR